MRQIALIRHAVRLFLAVSLYFSATGAWTQVAAVGDVIGTVSDQRGAAIAGAAIQLTERSTGRTSTQVSTEAGTYHFVSVSPGSFDLTFSAQGFGRLEAHDVTVLVGKTTEQNVVLKPASVSEVVDVNGSTPQVQTTRSDLGEVIDRERLDDLPLKNRDFASLATLVPQIVPAPAIDPTKVRVGNISVAGTAGRQSNAYVDGFENNDVCVGGLAYDVSPDAIQEFDVISMRFTAEQSRSAGAIVNIVQRSGTNQIHGSGFYLFRNQDLTAIDYFQQSQSTFRRQQQGGSIGGPFIKDKLFGFLTIEDHRELATGIVNTNGAYPQYDGSFPLPFRRDLVTAKLDYTPNDRQHMFWRYNLDDFFGKEATGGIISQESGRTDATASESAAFNHTYVVSPTQLNSLGVQLSQYHNHMEPLSTAIGESFPNLIIGQYPGEPQGTMERRIQAKDDYSWNLGKHAVKIGAEFQHIYLTGAFDFAGTGQFDFFNDVPLNSPFADILLMSRCLTTNCTEGVDTTNLYGAYIQDDWKVVPRLTLNLGLRWDYFTNEDDKTSTGFGPLQFPAGSRYTNPKNVGPRIGFAYNVFGTGKLVARGGYGLYYQTVALVDPILEDFFNSGRIGYKVFYNPGAISVSDPFPGLTPAQITAQFFQPPYSTFVLLHNGLHTPYYEYFTGGFQYQISKDFVLSVDGVHMLGVKGYITRDINVDQNFNVAAPGAPLCEMYGNAACQQFGGIPFEDNGDISHYNALVVSLTKTLSHRFQFNTSYTLSKGYNMSDDSVATEGISPVSNPFNYRAEWGPSLYDQRHRFLFNGVINPSGLPPFFGKGWELSIINTFSTPLPFDITTGSTAADGISISRPPGITRNEGNRGSQSQVLALVNSFLVSQGVAPLTRSLVPLDMNLRDTDLRLTKTFSFHDGGYRLKLQGEAYNVFNNANFISNGGPGGGYNGAGVNNFANSDLIGLPRATPGVLNSGGPRAFQLSARVEF